MERIARSLLAATVGLLAWAVPARAATLYADGTTCSLADAVRAANADAAFGGCAAGSGADVVLLGASVTLTAPAPDASYLEGGFAGLPDVTSDLTVIGLGPVTLARPRDWWTVSCDPDSGSFRLWNVLAGGVLRIYDIGLSGGCVGAAAASRGGAILVAGGELVLGGCRLSNNAVRSQGAHAASGGAVAVLAGGRLTVLDGSFDFNSAAGDPAEGGALWLADPARLEVVDTAFSWNAAQGLAGTPGGAAAGGAVAVRGGLVQQLRELDFESNTAAGGEDFSLAGGEARGGALWLTGAQLELLEAASFRNNRAEGGHSSTGVGGGASGGALAQDGGTTALWAHGDLLGNAAYGGPASESTGAAGRGGGASLAGVLGRMESVTLRNNSAGGGLGTTGGEAAGGGLCLGCEAPLSLTTLRNLTIHGNSAAGGRSDTGGRGGATGGGIAFGELTGGQVSHLSVVGNSVLVAAEPETAVGGGLSGGSSAITLDSSLLADNRWLLESSGFFWPSGADDCAGPVSGAANQIEAPGGCRLGVPGEVTGLASLGDHGCAVALRDGSCAPTVALARESSAVDQGSCAKPAPTDARGVLRPYNLPAVDNFADGCDAGAYELEIGELVLVVDVLPDADQDVEFRLDGRTYWLDDDGDPILPSRLALEVSTGAHALLQQWLEQHDTSVECDDPTGDTSVEFGNQVALQIAVGETVTCTFTNTRRGVITIVQDTVPDHPQRFDFHGPSCSFGLVDDGSAAPQRTWSASFPAGSYTFAQWRPSSHFPLTGLSCDDPSGGTVAELATQTVTVDLATAEEVTCTFQNGVLEGYFTIPPCRLYDSRAVWGKLQSGVTVNVDLGWRCDLPETARAVALNVTAVSPSGRGHLQLFATGTAAPPTSVLNFSAGQTRANNAIVALSPGGAAIAVRPFVEHDGVVHVVIDVYGYFH